MPWVLGSGWCAGTCRLSWRSEPWRASGLSSLARTQGSSSAAQDWRRACSSPKPQIQRTDHVQQQAPTGVVDPLIRAGANVKKPDASARRDVEGVVICVVTEVAPGVI